MNGESLPSQMLHWIIGGLAGACSGLFAIVFRSINSRIRELETHRHATEVCLARLETKVDLILKHLDGS